MGIYDEGEVRTLVRARELADGMMRELEATMPQWTPAPPSYPPQPTIEPEYLLPPPSLPPSNIYEASWSSTMPIAGAPAILRAPAQATTRKKLRKRSKSRLHWAVLAMSLALGVGLWRDVPARQNAVKQLKVESHRLKVSVVAKGQHVAKLVSARVI